ncbi:MAG TPA: flagellin [Acetobacteraceae bacterium]|nr:flagellin [Acetobacteraceae bacterium]
MSGVGAAGTTYDGLAGALLRDSTGVRQHLDTLLQQASSGRVADTYAGLGAGAGTSLAIAPQIAAQQAISKNIDAASAQMQVAQTALQQISAVASTFYADTNNLNGLDPSVVDSTAQAARQALQQVAGLLDSTDGGLYVFAGQDSGNPPVPDPGGILGSGFFTQIQSAVAGLSGSGAAGVIASTLATAASNASGTTPFSPALSQPAAVVQAQLPSVTTGAGQQVTTGIAASANAFVASTGTSTTGSYMRDVLRALATIGSLSSGQVNDAGFGAVVQDAHTSLGGALTALNQDAGALGNVQSTLQTEQSTLGASTTALQTQLAGAQDADMATTLSQITQTETRLQASYQMIAGLQSYSLAKFLTPQVG